MLISIGPGLDTTHPGARSAENPHTPAYSICRPGGGGYAPACGATEQCDFSPQHMNFLGFWGTL